MLNRLIVKVTTKIRVYQKDQYYVLCCEYSFAYGYISHTFAAVFFYSSEVSLLSARYNFGQTRSIISSVLFNK